MYDVIRYLFKYHLDPSVASLPCEEFLVEELREQGFSLGAIDHAMDWLGEVLTPAWRPEPNPGQVNIRAFSTEEQIYLSRDVRGFILYLEQLGILDPVTRELLIEQSIHDTDSDITLDDIQQLALTLLANIPGKRLLHTWLSCHLHADAHRGIGH